MKRHVRSRLRDLRIEAHLTQAQLAEILSIERATYCNYENETRTPPVDILIRLAELYHVSVDYLLRIKVPAGAGARPLQGPLCLEEQSLLSSFRVLSPEGRTSVLNFVAYTSAVDTYGLYSLPSQQ